MGVTYRFASMNKGTVEVSVVGEYRDSWCKDIDVSYEYMDGGERTGAGYGMEFEEIDDADIIIQWLVDEGVEFESERSMAFNRMYIQEVLIDQDATAEELLDMAASWTSEDITEILGYIERKESE